MATSVELRACGGIGPYTWSKTGNVVLSATTGTKITVSTDGANIDNFPSNVAYVDVGYTYSRTDAGDCGDGSGSRQDSLVVTVLNSFISYHCDGTLFGGGGLSDPGNDPLLPIHVVGATCGFGGPFSYDRNDSQAYTINGARHDTPFTISIAFGYYGTTYTAPTVTIPSTLGTNQLVTIQTNLDVRSAAMIAGGCDRCNDPSGATVTVTDAAGVSVTTTF